MAKGYTRYPNDVFDRLLKDPEKLAAWGWIERTRRYSDNVATLSISRIANRFSRSRCWARAIYNDWQQNRGDENILDTQATPARHSGDTPATGEAPENKEEIAHAKTPPRQQLDSNETAVRHHTKKQEAINKKQLTTTEIFTLPDGIPPDLWDSWMKIRSKKGGADTPRAKTALVKRLTESVKAGYDISETLETIVVKKWTGFEVDWLKNSGQGSKTFRQQEEENDADRIRRRNERFATSSALAQDARELSNLVQIEDSGGD